MSWGDRRGDCQDSLTGTLDPEVVLKYFEGPKQTGSEGGVLRFKISLHRVNKSTIYLPVPPRT